MRTWSLTDGYTLHGRVWPPRRSRPPVAFLYLHGIQSHGGWFEWSASLLAETGAPVLLPDRRGSGLNLAARGDTPCAERWLSDLDELADWAVREFGVQRFAVVGVSWGGKLAISWAVRSPDRVARLMLVAPGVLPKVNVGPLTKLLIGWTLLTDRERHFDIPLNDPALFTDNPPARQFIASDPLKLVRATARFLHASRRLDVKLRRLSAGALAAPTLLVLAGRDRIIHNAATEAWLRRIASQPIEVKRFTNSAHTLEFEPDAADYAEVLATWAMADRSVDSSGG